MKINVRQPTRQEKRALQDAMIARVQADVPVARAEEFSVIVRCDVNTVKRWISGDNYPNYFMSERIRNALKTWKV